MTTQPDVPAVLLYLADNAHHLARHPAAEQAWDELEHALATVVAAVDRRSPSQWSGRCSLCGRDLYVVPGETEAYCRPCNLVFQVEAQRDTMLDELNDRLVRASEAARILPGLTGLVLDRKDIDRWSSRGMLAAHSHDERGRPLYRVSEIVDVARRSPRRGSKGSASHP